MDIKNRGGKFLEKITHNKTELNPEVMFLFTIHNTTSGPVVFVCSKTYFVLIMSVVLNWVVFIPTKSNKMLCHVHVVNSLCSSLCLVKQKYNRKTPITNLSYYIKKNKT